MKLLPILVVQIIIGLQHVFRHLLIWLLLHIFDRLQQQGDSEGINVIVAMTDGQSDGDIKTIESKLREAKMPVLVFTVGYGEDAELDVLQRIAQLGEGQAYSSDPETIEQLYELISKFF